MTLLEAATSFKIGFKKSLSPDVIAMQIVEIAFETFFVKFLGWIGSLAICARCLLSVRLTSSGVSSVQIKRIIV